MVVSPTIVVIDEDTQKGRRSKTDVKTIARLARPRCKDITFFRGFEFFPEWLAREHLGLTEQRKRAGEGNIR